MLDWRKMEEHGAGPQGAVPQGPGEQGGAPREVGLRCTVEQGAAGRGDRPAVSARTAPLHSPAVVRRLLDERGLRPRKSLGQNFLVDGNIVERIARAVDPHPGEWIIEIGPGLGALTQALALRGARLIAVEKDGNLAGLLAELFAEFPDVRIVHADALEVDLGSLLPEPDSETVKIAGNLPYYITSPLLMALLDAPLRIERLVVMVQKEVADRLRAKPGTKAYGALTVAVARRATIESAGRVPPTVFYPAPAVESETLVLKMRGRPLDAGDPAVFRELVKAAFGMRRKTLRNALKSLDLPPGELEKALAKAGIDPGRRGETLSVEEFSGLSRALSESCVCYNRG